MGFNLQAADFLSSLTALPAGNWTSKLAEPAEGPPQQPQGVSATTVGSGGGASGGSTVPRQEAIQPAAAAPNHHSASATGSHFSGTSPRHPGTAAAPPLTGPDTSSAPVVPVALRGGSFAQAALTANQAGAAAASGPPPLTDQQLREQLAVKQSRRLVPLLARKEGGAGEGAAAAAARGRGRGGQQPGAGLLVSAPRLVGGAAGKQVVAAMTAAHAQQQRQQQQQQNSLLAAAAAAAAGADSGSSSSGGATAAGSLPSSMRVGAAEVLSNGSMVLTSKKPPPSAQQGRPPLPTNVARSPSASPPLPPTPAAARSPSASPPPLPPAVAVLSAPTGSAHTLPLVEEIVKVGASASTELLYEAAAPPPPAPPLCSGLASMAEHEASMAEAFRVLDASATSWADLQQGGSGESFLRYVPPCSCPPPHFPPPPHFLDAAASGSSTAAAATVYESSAASWGSQLLSPTYCRPSPPLPFPAEEGLYSVALGHQEEDLDGGSGLELMEMASFLPGDLLGPATAIGGVSHEGYAAASCGAGWPAAMYAAMQEGGAERPLPRGSGGGGREGSATSLPRLLKSQPEEDEAFLRSLGWAEAADEDGATGGGERDVGGMGMMYVDDVAPVADFRMSAPGGGGDPWSALGLAAPPPSAATPGGYAWHQPCAAVATGGAWGGLSGLALG